MAPKPAYIQSQMSRHTQEITGSSHGRGIALTMTVQVFEDGHCRFDGIPCGEPGTDGWNSLHEHVALRLGELNRELGRLKDGRRLLFLSKSEREPAEISCAGYGPPPGASP